MTKISFFNQKGGPGKTTSVVNIAACLAAHLEKRVLVVDCDSQMTATKYLLTAYQGVEYPTIDDYFSNKMPIKEIIKSAVYTNRNDVQIPMGIDVLPSCKNIETIKLKDEYQVRQMLIDVEDDYDYCLFDLPPHLSGISLNAIVASDYIIVPAIPDTDSLSGFDYLIDTVHKIREERLNNHLEILGIVFNNVVYQRATQKYILDSCRENMGNMVFDRYIKAASIVEQARFYGVPLAYFAPSNKITDEYKALTREILKRIEERGVQRNG